MLVVTPYYNKPTQEGMYQHFKAINDAIGIPIIIYNIPPRSVIDMSVETMARLFELKNIAGVKDATAEHGAGLAAARQAWARISTSCRARTPPCSATWRMAVMAASPSPPTWRRGCAPNFTSAWQKGDLATALKLHDKLMPLHTNLFIESNPAPVKYALSLLGKMDETLRLPMVPVTGTDPRRRCAAPWCMRA